MYRLTSKYKCHERIAWVDMKYAVVRSGPARILVYEHTNSGITTSQKTESKRTYDHLRVHI